MNAWTGIICAFVSAANQGEPVVSGMSAVYLVDDVAGEQWCQRQWTGERCQPRLQMSHEQGALSDVRSPYCRANEMATHCTQRCCKILSLWWLARCDISAGVILRWNTKTRSSEKIRQNWLSKQTLQTRFFSVTQIALSSLVTQSVLLLFLAGVIYIVGVNTFVSWHAQVFF